MEFKDVVRGRRSIRAFTDEPVSREVMGRILETATWAPSAQNLQPWFFQVLTKEEDLAWLFATVGTTAFSHRKHLEERYKNHPEIVESTMAFMEAMGGAKAVVLAYLYRPEYNEDVRESVVQSVAAAMNDLCLAAYEEGVGTCWVEHVTRVGGQIRDHFAPEHGALIGAVVMGYPAQSPRPPKRKGGRIEFR